MPDREAERVGVLFVCMGNICRSPVAEAIFADLVAPDPRSAREAARRGLALRHRARGVRPDDFQAFDWIIALDGNNLEALRARAPAGARAQLTLLRSFDPLSPPGADVPDPYYGGPEGFALVHDLCLRAARGLLDHLRPGPPPADPRQ
jgi:protein-tyrosine phosphatase